MKNFLKILIIALTVFFGVIYIQERKTLIYPLLGWVEIKSMPPKEFIENIVIDFNKSLVAAYEKGDAGLIKGADEIIKQDIEFEMLFLQDKGWVFLPKFSRLDISNIKVSSERSITVDTLEDWNIRIIDHKTQEERLKDEKYEMKYILEKRGAEWVIISIYPERAGAAKPKVNA